MTRVCKWCGKPLTKRQKTYCSTACIAQHRVAKTKANKVAGKCLKCGAPLKGGKKYCSYSCANSSRPPKESKKVTRICKECGKEFKIYGGSNLEVRGRGQFCSKPCANKWRKKHAKSLLVLRICKNCGKEFRIPPAWLKRTGKNTGQFCSRECTNQYWRKYGGPNSRRHRNPGGTFVSPDGYVFQYSERVQKMVPQHRLIMEQMIGRPLLKNETVHHKNGERDDNPPENLELWGNKHPSGVRISDVYSKDVERLALENYNLKKLLQETREELDNIQKIGTMPDKISTVSMALH